MRRVLQVQLILPWLHVQFRSDLGLKINNVAQNERIVGCPQLQHHPCFLYASCMVREFCGGCQCTGSVHLAALGKKTLLKEWSHVKRVNASCLL